MAHIVRVRMLSQVFGFFGITALLIGSSEGTHVPRVATPLSRSAPAMDTIALNLEKEVLIQLEAEFGKEAVAESYTPFHKRGTSVHGENFIEGLDAVNKPEILFRKRRTQQEQLPE